MLYSAFILGLISSLHCIGMCGPIAMMLPVDHQNEAKKVTQIITYHLGRLTAYGTIGLIFGLLGRGFFLAGMQQKMSIFIGIGNDSCGFDSGERIFKIQFFKTCL